MVLFNVDKQRLVLENKEYLVGNFVNYLEAGFLFDESWDAFSKWITVENEANKFNILLNEENMINKEDGANLIPGDAYIGVVGVSGNERMTTNKVRIWIHESSNVKSFTSADTPLSEIEQLTNLVVKSQEKAQEAMDYVVGISFRENKDGELEVLNDGKRNN